jgi:hypothetical protein
MRPAADGLDEPGNGLGLHYPELTILPPDAGQALSTAGRGMTRPALIQGYSRPIRAGLGSEWSPDAQDGAARQREETE